MSSTREAGNYSIFCPGPELQLYDGDSAMRIFLSMGSTREEPHIMAAGSTLDFRRANIEDISEVRRMILELAKYENTLSRPVLPKEDFIRDSGLNGGQELCHIYMLDLKEPHKRTIPIGYAICYFTYSTSKGRSYFIENMYVRNRFREIGATARLFREIVAKAKEYGCKQLDFRVLKRYTMKKFYERNGAINISSTEGIDLYRLDEAKINNFADQ